MRHASRANLRTASRVMVRAAVLAISPAVLPLAPTPLTGQEGAEIDLRAVIPRLEREIERAMLEGQIPSLTIALVSGEEILWSAGFGESNLRARTPATPSTVYMVASTFKPMAGAALLQLHENGFFDLDEPVRGRLQGIAIRGEDRRDPITFRHLLTHTSGLPTSFTPIPLWGDVAPPSLRSHLRENLIVQGPPLERVRYSNLGFTLLAHLLEEMTGKDFADYIRSRIFLAAGMASTDFVPTPEMEERMAVPYIPDPDTGRPVPTSRLRFAEWPAGEVWGTVEDQARWLAVNLNGGSFRGRRILSPETVTLSHTLQYPQFTGSMAGGWGEGQAGYGLGWWTTEREGERYIAHSGSVQGFTSLIHGNVDRKVGVAILTNGHRVHAHLVRLAFLATDLMVEHTR